MDNSTEEGNKETAFKGVTYGEERCVKKVRGDWMGDNLEDRALAYKMVDADLDTLTFLSENGKQGFEILGIRAIEILEVGSMFCFFFNWN